MSINDDIAAERRELAALLGGLGEADWDRASLCEGWRVREVVAHITMPFRYSPRRFIVGLARAKGNFNRMADVSARRDAAELSAAELTAVLRDNERHPWKPPRGGFEGALTHDVVHGLDITVALGLPREVPAERIRPVLAGLASAGPGGFFGVDVTGLELRASDLDWSHGSGEPLTGRAQDLALVLAGRRLPSGLLEGTAANRFTRTPGTASTATTRSARTTRARRPPQVP